MPDPTPAAATPTAPAKNKRKLLLFAVLGTVLLVGGGGAAAYFATGSTTGGRAEAAAAPKHVEPIYVALDPPFVVNFESSGLVRFLQVTVQAMASDPTTAELIKRHDPVIRNALLMLFSGQTYETLRSTAGKERLRLAALEEIRKVIAAEGGKSAEVRNVYFTSFVMQ